MKEFWIYGVNPVYEALKSARCRVKEVLVAQGRDLKGFERIAERAASKGIPLKKVERSSLDSLTRSASHQGVAGLITHLDYADLDDVLRHGKGEPLLLILDGVEDPRNLGALIRIADACGVWGVVIPKDRAAGITPVVAKSSAGAIFHIPIVRVTNIPTIMRSVKERGIWIVGASAEAETTVYEHDLTTPLAVVIGGEGKGMRPLVRRECDLLASIPMKGTVNSLNASVAGGIILYEVLRQRAKTPLRTRV